MTSDQGELLLREPTTLEPRIREELEALVGRRIIGPAREIGYDDLPRRGFSEPLLDENWWQRPNGDWLLATPRALDPVVEQWGGQMPAPPEVCEKLTALQRSGLSCEHVAVIHELPPGVKPGDPIPQLVPTARPAVSDAHALAWSRAGLDLTLQAVRGTALLGAGAVAGGLALGAAVPALAGDLDPILLGGVEHPDAPVVAWVELARWAW